MTIAYIGINNGHGKNTPGKRVPDDSMREWDFNYPTAKYLKEELEYNNFKTLMISDTPNDTPLRERTNKANKSGINLYVAIHANAYLGKWGEANGIETFAYKPGTQGDKLAKFVQEELIQATRLRDREVKYDNLHETRETTMPAILVECGFMDNKKESELLKSDAYRRTCAKAIAKGICRYYGVTYKDKDSISKKDKNCILYGNDIDKVAATVLSWSKDDCIVKNVKDHIPWEATNLFVVGGPSKTELDKMNTGEKYTAIIGTNRYDTVRKCLELAGK